MSLLVKAANQIQSRRTFLHSSPSNFAASRTAAEIEGIIDEHGQEVNTGCISLKIRFQGVFGAATSGVTLLSVIDPLRNTAHKNAAGLISAQLLSINHICVGKPCLLS